MSAKNLLILFLFLSGCAIKTHFSEEELLWLKPYNEGDTLIFASDTGSFDTTIIIEKRIYYPEYNPIELHGKYLPHYGVIKCKNKFSIKYPAIGNLIELAKSKPDTNTSLAISFNGSFIIMLDIEEELSKYKKLGEVFIFDCAMPKTSLNEPVIIFWHEDKGLIKYVNKDGTTWNIKNRRIN